MTTMKRTAAPQATISTKTHAVTVRINEVLHRKLKIHCAEHDLKIQDLMQTIIALHLNRQATGRVKK